MTSKTLTLWALGATVLACGTASAGMVTESHGTVGYDTAAECDAAVAAGTAKFYTSFTHKPPLKRAGEASVKSMPLKELGLPAEAAQALNYSGKDYSRGACDIGAGRSGGRDGVAKELQGKYVPYSPEMMVNVYYDKQGVPVRASMKQCDNWFGARLPRPIPAPVPVAKPAPAPAPAPAPVVTAPPAPPAPPVAQAPVVPKPVAPAPVKAAVTAAKGGIGWTEVLGTAAVIGVGAVLLNSDGDTRTTGTTGTTGTN